MRLPRRPGAASRNEEQDDRYCFETPGVPLASHMAMKGRPLVEWQGKGFLQNTHACWRHRIGEPLILFCLFALWPYLLHHLVFLVLMFGSFLLSPYQLFNLSTGQLLSPLRSFAPLSLSSPLSLFFEIQYSHSR